MSAPAGAVNVRREGAVVYITFDRPAARNAMTMAMYDQLAHAVGTLDPDDGVRAAVLRGAAGTFVAGTDIAHFAGFATGDDGLAYERRIDDVVEHLDSAPVPTLAVVEGYAAGAGLILTAACDLRICTPDARFGAPIARTVGNCLSMANYARLVAHLGLARTKAMLLTAQFLTAKDARAAGFVLDVVTPREIDARVNELCRTLVDNAPVTLQVTREAVRRIVAALAVDGDDLVRRAYASRDFQEGVTAFLEKRKPHWEGR